MSASAATLEADGVRVVFFRDGDRYAHRIETYDPVATAWDVACRSCEGAAEDPWPPSPPWQQLHVERRAAGPVILLVGMAGRSHWSAAVEATADGRGIIFDTAVRVQCRPQRLGNAYAAAAAPPRILPFDGACCESATEPRPQVRVVPAEPTAPPPTTIGWKYAIFKPLR